MTAPILNLGEYLDRAEAEYLLKGSTHFSFGIRRKAEIPGFYERLDRELQLEQRNNLRVLKFRTVKEGYTKISRPAEIGFDSSVLFRHRPDLPLLKSELDRLRIRHQALNATGFIEASLSDCRQDIAKTNACFEVLDYLVTHRAALTGLLPRQIPHGQSTKLIGKENLLLRLFSHWRNEPCTWRHFFHEFKILDKPAEFRFFAPHCYIQGQGLENFHGLLAMEWIKTQSFQNCRATLIVENFESFYAVAQKSQFTVVIWGSGWKAVHLKPLLGYLPRPIYYWGDIDKEGFEIYGLLKANAPELTPVLMDQSIIDKYSRLVQKKDRYYGPYREAAGLQSEYQYVCHEGLQIEQEQLAELWPFHPGLG